ncbi:hypothetical protein CR513_57511, partial [Mucuna pruriens]
MDMITFTSSKVEEEVNDVGATLVAVRGAEAGSRRESDEIPKDFLSNPQALMHSSLSICSFSFSASISEVLHVYASSPLLFTRFSSTHRFPSDDTANAHVSCLKFSHSISPEFHHCRVLY